MRVMGRKITRVGEDQTSKPYKTGGGAAVGVPRRWLEAGAVVKSKIIKLEKRGAKDGKTPEKN